MERWEEIHAYWFGAPDTPEYGTVREMWFRGGPAVDAEIRDCFLADYERAAGGECADWKATHRSCMALIVLLDQFPRNMFRGEARAFAADALARDAADHIVSGPLRGELMTVEKVFAYLPFEHCESLVDQDRCVALFEALEPHDAKQEWLDYAVQHRDLIARFGRFPHRNAILGRESTADEAAWLAESDQRFGTVVAEDDSQ